MRQRPAGLFRQGFKNARQVRRHAIGREPSYGRGVGAAPDRFAQHGIGGKPVNRRREGARISGRRDERITAGFDELGGAAMRRRDLRRFRRPH